MRARRDHRAIEGILRLRHRSASARDTSVSAGALETEA